MDACKRSEGSRFELVNQKNMTPSVLKDGTAFRNWREEFERYAGIKVKGLQGVLKLIGGRKNWRRRWKHAKGQKEANSNW